MDNTLALEYHPFEPFAPAGATVLFLGTFPPPPSRWSMNFYYPNYSNDFWKIIGLIFLGDPEALLDRARHTYRLERIKELLTEKGIAMKDTARAVRRLKGNASDKFLEIVETVDFAELRRRLPSLRAAVATGEKACDVLAGLAGLSEAPRMGEMMLAPDGLEIWRMPSTSRAYPLPLEKKAAYYRRLFDHLEI